MQFLYNAVSWLLGGIWMVIQWGADAFFLIVKGVIWLTVSGLLQAVQVLFDSFSYSSVAFQWAAGYSAIPPQAIYIMVRIGFPEMLTILAAAYALRLALNIVPGIATRV